MIAALLITLCVIDTTSFAAPTVYPSGSSLADLLDPTRVVDLSYPYNNATIYWPNLEPLNVTFSLTSLFDERQDDHYYRSKAFKSAEHGGTHLDAPSHFAENGKDVSALQIGDLMGPAVVVNVADRVVGNSDYQVSIADIERWEAQHGRIPDGAFVLMFSNWTALRYPNKAQVFGSANYTDVTTLHFPGFHPNTTTFLVDQRSIRGVGVDTPSTDHGQSKNFQTHVILAKHGKIGLENVANLDKLPASGAVMFIAPLKIDNGSGAPARIYAFLPGPRRRFLFGDS